MKNIIIFLMFLLPIFCFAQTKFAYGINGGIGISKAEFITPNTIAGLSIQKSNFVHFAITSDWLMGNNFRIGLAIGLDAYKDRYLFDELEYLSVNHPEILKTLNAQKKTFTKTNSVSVPSFSIVYQYDYHSVKNLSILPYIGYKFNYVPLYKDSLSNQLSIGSSVVPDFVFNDWLYRPNEFNFSFVIGTKFRWYVSKKHLLQLGIGYEYLTKNLKQGTLRINYLGKDSREQVKYTGNNVNISIGIMRYKNKTTNNQQNRN